MTSGEDVDSEEDISYSLFSPNSYVFFVRLTVCSLAETVIVLGSNNTLKAKADDIVNVIVIIFNTLIPPSNK